MTDDKQLSDISGWIIVRYFLYGFALVCISDVPNNWGILFILARGVLALLLLVSFVQPIRSAVLLLLMLAIAGQDIVSFGDSAVAYSTASIWQMKFGPINPGWIIFGCLLFQLVKIWKILEIPPVVKRAILWFATVPVITGVFYGGFFSDQAGIEVVQDIKFAFMLISSTILFLSIFRRDPHYMTLFLAYFAGVLLARHLMDLIYLFANIGPVITAGVSRGSTDSAKGTVVFLSFFGVILIWIKRHLLLGMAVTIASTLLLFAYGTRNLWITLILGAVMLLLLLDIRRTVLFFSIATVLTIGGGWTLMLANPQSAVVALARIKTITEGRQFDKFSVQVKYNLISRIDPVRYAEIVNVFSYVRKRHAYLWGIGYGGYYKDDVESFPRGLKSAFAQYSFDTGQFYKTHTFSSHIFLKYGLLGMLYIYALWFIPGFTLVKIWRKWDMFAADQPIFLNGTMLCIAAFLPTAMLQTYWSSKGLFINGIVIALCLEFARHYPIGASSQNMQQRPVMKVMT
ncbi:MAG: hypothetical protein HQ525_09135 [Anaerolineae bacterium]|nr:hypothetical protein [Anaerolineae bacterium]